MINVLTGIGIIAFLIVLVQYGVQNRRLKDVQRDAAKYKSLFQVLALWLEAKQNDLSFKVLLDQKGYSSVAIYGVHVLGERLLDDLRDAGIDVLYGIDRKNGSMKENLQVYKPSENLPAVDVVIVTAVNDFEVIKQELEKKVACPIVALDDLLCELSVL